MWTIFSARVPSPLGSPFGIELGMGSNRDAESGAARPVPGACTGTVDPAEAADACADRSSSGCCGRLEAHIFGARGNRSRSVVCQCLRIEHDGSGVSGALLLPLLDFLRSGEYVGLRHMHRTRALLDAWPSKRRVRRYRRPGSGSLGDFNLLHLDAVALEGFVAGLHERMHVEPPVEVRHLARPRVPFGLLLAHADLGAELAVERRVSAVERAYKVVDCSRHCRRRFVLVHGRHGSVKRVTGGPIKMVRFVPARSKRVGYDRFRLAVSRRKHVESKLSARIFLG